MQSFTRQTVESISGTIFIIFSMARKLKVEKSVWHCQGRNSSQAPRSLMRNQPTVYLVNIRHDGEQQIFISPKYRSQKSEKYWMVCVVITTETHGQDESLEVGDTQ
jgi:hypothetical protein